MAEPMLHTHYVVNCNRGEDNDFSVNVTSFGKMAQLEFSKDFVSPEGNVQSKGIGGRIIGRLHLGFRGLKK